MEFAETFEIYKSDKEEFEFYKKEFVYMHFVRHDDPTKLHLKLRFSELKNITELFYNVGYNLGFKSSENDGKH